MNGVDATEANKEEKEDIEPVISAKAMASTDASHKPLRRLAQVLLQGHTRRLS